MCFILFLHSRYQVIWIPFGCLGFTLTKSLWVSNIPILCWAWSTQWKEKNGTWIQAQPRTLSWVGLCRPRLINLVGLALPIYGPKSYALAIQCHTVHRSFALYLNYYLRGFFCLDSSFFSLKMLLYPYV